MMSFSIGRATRDTVDHDGFDVCLTHTYQLKLKFIVKCMWQAFSKSFMAACRWYYSQEFEEFLNFRVCFVFDLAANGAPEKGHGAKPQ